MRYFMLLALCAIGCGQNWTNYDVRIGDITAPVCTGYMQIVGTSGTWACWPYGGKAVESFAPNTILLDLETSSGYFNRVRGTDNGGMISGEITFAPSSREFVTSPFYATPQ